MEEREIKRNDGRDGMKESVSMIERIEGDKDEWGRQGEEEKRGEGETTGRGISSSWLGG